MKKILATALAAALCLCAVSFAEGAATDLGVIGVPYEQRAVILENGAAFSLPASWTDAPLTGEMTRSGVLYCAADPEHEAVMGLAYTETSAPDAQTLAAHLAETFANVGVVAANGVELVTYQAADASYVAFARLDGQGGLYTMTYAPIPAADTFLATAAAALSTLAFPGAPRE